MKEYTFHPSSTSKVQIDLKPIFERVDEIQRQKEE